MFPATDGCCHPREIILLRKRGKPLVIAGGSGLAAKGTMGHKEIGRALLMALLLAATTGCVDSVESSVQAGERRDCEDGDLDACVSLCELGITQACERVGDGFDCSIATMSGCRSGDHEACACLCDAGAGDPRACERLDDGGGSGDSGAPPATSPSGDIFSLDFNHHDLHVYDDTDVRSDWDANGNITLDPGAMEIFADPELGGRRDRVLRVNYEGGQYSYGGVSGGQWWKLLDDYDEIYYAFDVYFEPGFDFVKGGKLPSPRSTGYREEGKAGVEPDGTDFWTAGLSWGAGGELRSYVYHANQNTRSGFGQHLSWNDGSDGQDTFLIPGTWHRVEIRVKLNTPGILDGRLEGWFDGEKRLDTSSLMFRMPGGEHLKIGTLLFYSFFGGGDSSFAATKDEHVYFDNFGLSSEPITH